MESVSLRADAVGKTFGRTAVLSHISFDLRSPASLSVTGHNGSGKSTLLKILAGIMPPTRGTVSITSGGAAVPESDRFTAIGFVSPYLQLYDEFTAWENLDFLRKVRTVDVSDDTLRSLLDRVRLPDRGSDEVRTFSSGMKQRLKVACALLHDPPILFLDEPTSNLDSEGKETVRAIVEERRGRAIVCIATNEPGEAAWCADRIDLDRLPAGGGRRA